MNFILFKRLFIGMSFCLLCSCQLLRGPDTVSSVEFSPIREFPLFDSQEIIGVAAQIETDEQDSLLVIGRHFGLGYDEITRANSNVDPWLPEPGSTVRLPLRFIIPEAPRKGVVLNLAAKRLFLYDQKNTNKVFTYPVGIGREGWETPQGLTRITAKTANPSWTVPESIRREHAKKGDPLPRVVPAGPNNPLGDYALRLGFPGYLIHGTNKPYGVGMEVSHGCVRLYPEDIAKLFRHVAVGSQVRIVNQPFLTAWDGDTLFLQAYPPTHKDPKQVNRLVQDLIARLQKIEQESGRLIDWDKVHVAIERSDGVLTPILKGHIDDFYLTISRPSIKFKRPIPKAIDVDAWKLNVATLPNVKQARQFAAMLNHQGPPIPAHAFATKVIAGPFSSSQDAFSAKKRLLSEFSITAQIMEPGKIVETPQALQESTIFTNLLTFFD
ncbi:ErfK/YbiS/YcfS/YnhG family protein [Methylotuvimicrobium alcaliphilum 20Z]|uniref:ErfK/YbiS/YcfS/YnhG family protein n=2 Tax=Methylotuvimicrobium alcaliphilum TaxID=271065 RepID=G4T2V5_META2|nr:ErfK/YbiS/YcfS/YnhG family protein [Methylotuvimicrobium alcaliphilum 20Z]